jgi:holliday junction resolvase Hjr
LRKEPKVNQKAYKVKIARQRVKKRMSQKSKGTNAERELIHALWAKECPAIRVAGSGSNHYPSPDIVAGKIGRILVIECKSAKSSAVYIPKEEIEELKEFAKKFGAEPWIAIRFKRKEWYFLTPEDMAEKEKSYSASLDTIKLKGILLSEII